MCKNKLGFTKTSLMENLERLNNATNLDPREILQNSLLDLEKIKMRLIEQIEIYFSKLKEEFSTRFLTSASKISNFKEL